MWLLFIAGTACGTRELPVVAAGNPVYEVEILARVDGARAAVWSGQARTDASPAPAARTLLPGRCEPVQSLPPGTPEVATLGVTGALTAAFLWDEASGLYRVPAGRADKDPAWGVADLHYSVLGAQFVVPAAVHFGPVPTVTSAENGAFGGVRLGWEGGRSWTTELVVATDTGLIRCGTARDGMDVPESLVARARGAWLRTVVVGNTGHLGVVVRVRTVMERAISLENPVADELPTPPRQGPASPARPFRWWGPPRAWG